MNSTTNYLFANKLRGYLTQTGCILLMLGISWIHLECSRKVHPDTAYILPERGLCAHRGALDSHPENTLPAFEEAIRLGAHMIEFDIQISKDSALVIMHDETVDRTTNGKGEVANLTLAEIKQLDAGVKKSARFSGVRVPVFEEVLAIMPRNIWLNCHLKGGREAGRLAAQVLAKSGRMHQAFLACGEDAAQAAHQVNPRILICNMEEKYRKNTPEYVNSTVATHANFLQLTRNPLPDKELIHLLKSNRIQINYYYAKEPAELASLYTAGVNFVLVNELSRFLPEAKKLSIEEWKPVF